MPWLCAPFPSGTGGRVTGPSTQGTSVLQHLHLPHTSGPICVTTSNPILPHLQPGDKKLIYDACPSARHKLEHFKAIYLSWTQILWPLYAQLGRLRPRGAGHTARRDKDLAVNTRISAATTVLLDYHVPSRPSCPAWPTPSHCMGQTRVSLPVTLPRGPAGHCGKSSVSFDGRLQ